jgi:hypothetical protein
MTDDAVLTVSEEDGAGKLTVFNLRNGATRSTTSLPSAPAQDGMAIAHGFIFVALRDGTLVCLR